MNLALKEFPQLGKPIPEEFAAPAEMVARVYAMVTNIDTNVGKVLKALEAKGLAEQHDRRLPHRQWPRPGAVQRRPARVERVGVRRRHPRPLLHPLARALAGRRRGRPHRRPYRPGAHVARRLRRSAPAGVRFDGKSLLPLLTGIQTAGWPDRTLFFQWHRGDQPELGRAFAARSQSYKLLRHEPPPGATKVPPLELYDMERDPLELHDIAKEHPDIVSRMYADYKAWFKDVSSTRGFEPVRIALGSPRENPTILTRQDWRGPRADRRPNALGFWEVEVAKSGRFDITLHVHAPPVPVHGPHRIRKPERRTWLLPPGRPSARSRASSCRRARGDWKPGSRGTRPRPACST